jgi:Uma2 family endonuclease
MASQPKSFFTPEEYLAFERKSEFKHEYIDGEIFEMSGNTREHNLVVTNLVSELRQQLKGGPCEVYPSNMRVRVPGTRFYTYPDVVVVCDEPKLEDNEFDTLLNPTVIFEVLSESTEKYDRGKKFWRYREIESLRAYILVSQDVPRIEQFSKQSACNWTLSDAASLDVSIEIEAIGCTLALREVYDRVVFES